VCTTRTKYVVVHRYAVTAGYLFRSSSRLRAGSLADLVTYSPKKYASTAATGEILTMWETGFFIADLISFYPNSVKVSHAESVTLLLDACAKVRP
jgi:hypothetical protein